MASSQHPMNRMDNREVYKDHDIELQYSSKDESYDSSNDESNDSSNDESHDPSNDDNSPRIQIPEDSLPDLYSSCELEIARLSLVDDVNDGKDDKWCRLKYKLGMSRDNEEADSIRNKMLHCMFDVHSSEWCQVPLISNCGTINVFSVQMNPEDSTSSAKDKSVDEGSESSPVISNEKANSDAESDDAIKESDDCTLKNSIVSKRHQQGYEETEIDFYAEPEHPNLASLC